MLTPEYLEDLPEEILQLFYEAEQEILADMARRVSTYDYWIPAAEYQRQKLREAGVYVCKSNRQAAQLAGEIVRLKKARDTNG